MNQRSAPRQAWLFDVDGVLTPTVDLHRAAWAEVFTALLARSDGGSNAFSDQDYFALVDGKPRFEAVRAVLAARGIHLPDGDPAEAGSLDTVFGLGNLKNAVFRDRLRRCPARAYPGSARLVDQLWRAAVPLGVVSASHNARAVLASAGLIGYFAVIIDAEAARRAGLAGKPAPDTYLEAARQLGAAPNRTGLVEDALSGVAAGRAGGFDPVIGVDRGAGRAGLLAQGASRVVEDLAELVEDLSELVGVGEAAQVAQVVPHA